MTSVPGFGRELIRRKHFYLVSSAGPCVKEITAPAFGRDLHVGGPLSPGVTVEAGVAHDSVEHRTRKQLIAIGYADGRAVAAIVRRSTLGNERIDVREFDCRWENIEVDTQQVAGRQDHLDFGE